MKRSKHKQQYTHKQKHAQKLQRKHRDTHKILNIHIYIQEHKTYILDMNTNMNIKTNTCT